ncbi:MAG: PQQ-dependent sugar dehydrogenase [Gammaproteobacteria bacterium]|nr:PQQ-dependent sugar dehydrogenase [Gammaproteobacteria bacterium]
MRVINRSSCLKAVSWLLLALGPAIAQAEIEQLDSGYPGVRVEQMVRGLGVPWGMTFVSPSEILLTERRGSVRLFDIDKLTLRQVEGAPAVEPGGQGGLLDVAAGPGFAADGWIYFTYSKAVDNEAATTLARARLENGRLGNWQELLVTDSVTGSRRHFGSRITFDDSGHVFFGVGDRGERDMAQDTGNHIGAVIRLRLDGSIPADNPFTGDPAVRDEIWSYGHRNPQGLVYDRPTRRLWLSEHGPRGGDEINLVLPGRNYGWPVISYGKEYWGPLAVGEGTHKEGMEQPRKYYDPSIAPGSLMLYRGEAFPEWQGNLFSGALKLRHLNRVQLSAEGEAIGEERLLEGLGERIRAVIEGPDGLIYLSTDSGSILRLRPD